MPVKPIQGVRSRTNGLSYWLEVWANMTLQMLRKGLVLDLSIAGGKFVLSPSVNGCWDPFAMRDDFANGYS